MEMETYKALPKQIGATQISKRQHFGERAEKKTRKGIQKLQTERNENKTRFGLILFFCVVFGFGVCVCGVVRRSLGSLGSRRVSPRSVVYLDLWDLCSYFNKTSSKF